MLDTDVVAACLLGEAERADSARQVLDQAEILKAPDYLQVELANVLWKAALQGRVSADSVTAMQQAVLLLGIDWTPAAELLAGATVRAIEARHPVYDMLFVELAARTEALVVSFDRRLQAVAPRWVCAPEAWLASRR